MGRGTGHLTSRLPEIASSGMPTGRWQLKSKNNDHRCPGGWCWSRRVPVRSLARTGCGNGRNATPSTVLLPVATAAQDRPGLPRRRRRPLRQRHSRCERWGCHRRFGWQRRRQRRLQHGREGGAGGNATAPDDAANGGSGGRGTGEPTGVGGEFRRSRRSRRGWQHDGRPGRRRRLKDQRDSAAVITAEVMRGRQADRRPL